MRQYTLKDYKELLENAGILAEFDFCGREDGLVTNITYNSREAAEGALFICKGAHFSEEYLKEALSRGAIAYVSEAKYDTDGVPNFIVSDMRVALALIADHYHEHVWKNLHLVGVTGTKGKSTTTYYIKSILDDWMHASGGEITAILSGIDNYDGVIDEESHLTTPETFELYGHFDHAVSKDIKYLSMEVSSQALKYERTRGIIFDAVCFLNIDEDHISEIEHSDYEDYFSSKLRIFSQCRYACVNLGTRDVERVLQAAGRGVDSSSGLNNDRLLSAGDGTPGLNNDRLLSAGDGALGLNDDRLLSAGDGSLGLNDDRLFRAGDGSLMSNEPILITFGYSRDADVRAYDVRSRDSGIRFRVKAEVSGESIDEEFEISMTGLFNVENALAAISAALCLGTPVEYIKSGLKRARVSGRMEVFKSGEKTIIVDYAHNRLSFETLFKSVKEEYPGKKISIVFGCPGKKALGRRRELGTLAGEYADSIILTEEDAGEESVPDICHEIEGYVNKGSDCRIIANREEAIKAAVESADSEWVVLITGKGRETRQKRGLLYINTPSDVDYVENLLTLTPPEPPGGNVL